MKKENFIDLFLPVIGGFLIGILISGFIDYNFLVKPPLSPPSFIFPIVWTIIYLLMGLSYYLLKSNSNPSKTDNIVYYLQLIVNYSWSIIFFIFKLRFLAIIVIIILDILVIYMIYQFYKKFKLSAYLNILYLIWILFATYLTIAIYILN